MALDPRSRQRLEQLGRSLPQALPSPEPPTAGKAGSNNRHRIETETDPEQLFGELMRASPDGTVPPHLLDRLRQLEQQPSQQRRGNNRTPSKPPSDPRYIEFQQMLLEDDAL